MPKQGDLFARRKKRRAKPTKCNGRTASGRIRKGYRLTRGGLRKAR